MSDPNALLSRLQTYPSCSLDHSELAHPTPVEFGWNTLVDSVVHRMGHPTAAIRPASPLAFAASPRETGAKSTVSTTPTCLISKTFQDVRAQDARRLPERSVIPDVRICGDLG